MYVSSVSLPSSPSRSHRYHRHIALTIIIVISLSPSSSSYHSHHHHRHHTALAIIIVMSLSPSSSCRSHHHRLVALTIIVLSLSPSSLLLPSPPSHQIGQVGRNRSEFRSMEAALGRQVGQSIGQSVSVCEPYHRARKARSTNSSHANRGFWKHATGTNLYVQAGSRGSYRWARQALDTQHAR